MSKAFSVASWNVKHFKKGDDPVDSERVNRVLTFLKNQSPDVFALYEVVGKDLWRDIMKKFPKYVFEITEGRQTQEILVGIRDGYTCFMTQRVEFKSGVTAMRPGLLATILLDDVEYSLLFLHLASFPKPRGFGLRDDMMYKALKLRKHLDENVEGEDKAHYIIMGDLNTMGLKYPFNRSISANTELRNWDEDALDDWKMKRLTKTFDKTWRSASNGKESNLDHVYASTNLTFKEFEKNDVKGFVDVRGWVDEPNKQKKNEWVEAYSDHSLLYFEAEKVGN